MYQQDAGKLTVEGPPHLNKGRQKQPVILRYTESQLTLEFQASVTGQIICPRTLTDARWKELSESG